MSSLFGRRAAPFAAVLATALLAGCAGLRPPAGPVVASPPAYPEAMFAVLSDIHVYDRSLGITGAAFQKYLEEDRKLLVESEEILRAALERIDATAARFLIISGDLTKDGEESSHRLVVEYLAAMERTGRQVYVIPGNHDVRNPDALRFTGDTTEPVKHLEPEEFAALYDEFGYGQALERDPSSLSYVAEPVPGLWLLAIDSCDTTGNLRAGKPKTASGFSPERLSWITLMLERAAAQGKAVIAVIHHGVVQHYASQDKYFPEYLAESYDRLARLLAQAGVRVAFSGHYHAQDIALRRWSDGAFIYDVETGSAVTWPCPYRLIAIGSDGAMRIDSARIESLPSFREGGVDFGSFARQATYDGINGVAVSVMVGLGMKRAEAQTLSGQISDAMLAHYAGDERFGGTEMLRLKGLSLMGRIVVGTRKSLVYDLWRDLEPSDNAITIRLDTGTWAPAGSSP